MGLAASQARFLGLTARKSNVEYQGQQINQARTALSNEVMGLYRKYNSLDVPVPPSKTDYTKTLYTLNETYEGYTIKNFKKIAKGNEYEGYYKVTLQCGEDIAEAYTNTFKDSVVTATKDGNNIKYLSFKLGAEEFIYNSEDEKASTVEKITLTGSNKEEMEKYAQKYTGLSVILSKQGYDVTINPNFYRFDKGGRTYYVWESNLPKDYDEKDADGRDIYYGAFTFDYQGERKQTKLVDAIASLTQEKDGRLSSINVIKCEDDEDLNGNQYSITVSTTEDDVAYQDAMNKYNYNKDKYERQVEIINKKTEAIQREDRSLELKLGQLDTEQNALKTEMESISKVIEDTINSVFKTYNS